MTTLDQGYRAVAAVHDLDETKHQVIVEIPHRSFDRHGSDFDNDCFKESFARQLPEMRREHSVHIGDGLRAEVLPHANRLVGQFDDTLVAHRAFDDIASGRLKGWSFHYYNRKHVPHPVHHGIRYVSADMDEFSAVSRPSIPGTKTTGLRSEPDALTRLLEVQEHAERVTGQRSELTLNAYEHPGLYLDWVQDHADDVMDEMVEERYRLFEAQRDGLMPKTPKFRLQEIFARNVTRDRHR